MLQRSFAIRPAQSSADLDAVSGLFRDYAASLNVDLSYQDFDAELAGLPGKYAAPEGELLIARDAEGRALGCVGLRLLADSVSEMKRLYVRPEARGLGLGKALVDAVIGTATRIGYREIWLDTLPSMTSAIVLYRAAGFVPIPAYYQTPIARTQFLGRRLAPAQP